MQPKEKLHLKISCRDQTHSVRAQRAHEYEVIYSVPLAAQVEDEVLPKVREYTLGSDLRLRPGLWPGPWTPTSPH